MVDDTKDMIRKRTKHIALVQDSKGLGTGLVVGSDGWILTNRHVAPSVGPFASSSPTAATCTAWASTRAPTTTSRS